MHERRWPTFAAAMFLSTGCMLDLPDRAAPPSDTTDSNLEARAFAPQELVGRFQTNWGFMTLSLADVENGVVGYYGEPVEGRLAGTVTNGRFTFIWAGNQGTHGRGYFERAADGTFTGKWGYGESETNGGDWVASRA